MKSSSKKIRGGIKSLSGEITVPGDKSITHRAIILSSIAKGISTVSGISKGADCMSTVKAFRQMGIAIQIDEETATIDGHGLKGLKEPSDVINAENSGTTIRLLTGLLAGRNFLSVITGDNSLRERPMGRIVTPLKMMGANITAREKNTKAPVVIKGKKLKSVKYVLPVSSAQVKTALILAGLQTEGITEIIEPSKSRDHTERMLKHYGGNIRISGNRIHITKQPEELTGRDFTIPGDFSSAAFFIAAAAIIKNSKLRINGICLNKTRTGFLQAFKKMGGRYKILNKVLNCGEPCGNLIVESSQLKAINFPKALVPSAIDEFPILFILAAFARGTSVFRNIGELRFKESDRISAMATGLKKMGVHVEEGKDWIKIEGAEQLQKTVIDSRSDHRVAMSFSIAALCAEGVTTIKNANCVKISFPQFYQLLNKITKGR